MQTETEERNEGGTPPPTDETITATEAGRVFGDLLNRVGYGGKRIIITKHGRAIAALVAIADMPEATPAAA